jgi:hypothetical protein
VRVEGPVFAIHQSDELLGGMDAWNKGTHGKSGLIDKVKASTISEAEAEAADCLPGQIRAQGQDALCGNSIGQDRRFMERYMPKLDNFFHYRNIDVSTLKELAKRWKPEVYLSRKRSATRPWPMCMSPSTSCSITAALSGAVARAAAGARGGVPATCREICGTRVCDNAAAHPDRRATAHLHHTPAPLRQACTPHSPAANTPSRLQSQSLTVDVLTTVKEASNATASLFVRIHDENSLSRALLRLLISLRLKIPVWTPCWPTWTQRPWKSKPNPKWKTAL